MNKHLLTKILKFNDHPCPQVTYENPLLDRNLSRALAKGFVKILKVTNQDVTNNLRLCVLENIRKICIGNADGHKVIDDNLIAMLTAFYNLHLTENNESCDSLDRKLDGFLLRQMKDLNSAYQSSLNPELIQALINLNCQGVYLEKLSSDLIHWDMRSDAHSNFIQNLWTTGGNAGLLTGTLLDDVSIKMKAEQEKLLLVLSLYLLKNKDVDIESYIALNEDIKNLIKKSSVSPECFQTCIGIINFIFMTTNFDQTIQEFITVYLKNVKSLVTPQNFMILYPRHLNTLPILMDTNLDIYPEKMKLDLIKTVKTYLKNVHKDSEHDLVLMLSHYPQWFNKYFNEESLNPDC